MKKCPLTSQAVAHDLAEDSVDVCTPFVLVHLYPT